MNSATGAPPQPFATHTLVALCVGGFLLQWLEPTRSLLWGALWPLGDYFHVWQFVSYAFLHGNLSHLIFNLFGVLTFGAALEQVLGARRLVTLYFVSVLTAAAAQLTVATASGSIYPTVGASGGLFGLMLVFALLFPQRKLLLLFPPVPLPAWLFVSIYALIELTLGVTGTQSGVAHFAHLGGLLGGGLTWLIWRTQAARRATGP
ncbi:MAG: rhomboid family intramembrane serine protease [Verrucomicrobia bacterium]|nr:rhomboid family intramembrane serine protease [Verrucomicrobiota bacterium]